MATLMDIKETRPDRSFIKQGAWEPTFLRMSASHPLQGSLFCEILTPEHRISTQVYGSVCLLNRLNVVRKKKLTKSCGWETIPPGLKIWVPGDDPRMELKGQNRNRLLFIRPERIEQIIGRSFDPTRLATADDKPTKVPFVDHVLSAFAEDIANGCPAGALVGDSLVVSLVNWLIQAKPTDTRCKPGILCPKTYAKIIDYIEAHLADSISLDDLCGVADLSPRRFYRLLKEATGLSPHRLVLSRRVERAARLIRHSQAGLADIAAEVGFADQSQMTKTFHRFLGMPPARYRNTVS